MTTEKRNKSNKLDLDWECEAVPQENVQDMPLPRLKVDLAADPPTPGGPGGVDELHSRMQTLEFELSALRKKQETMELRHQDCEAVRRGQLDCLSERVYEAEKSQRQVQERTDDAIEKARAAFQKTASDMEHERINLMSVINQVNQNFEHLSREMGQVSDLVTRTQQDLIHLQQEVAERCVDDATTVARQMAMEEQHSNHLRDLQQAQLSLSQQLMELQCQVVPLMDRDRALGHFRQEVGSYLEQLTLMVRDSEAQCLKRLSEQVVKVKKEVSLQVAAFLSQTSGPQHLAAACNNCDDDRRSEGEVPRVSSMRSYDGRGTEQAMAATAAVPAPEPRLPPHGRSRSRQFLAEEVYQAKEPEEGQDHRLLEYLLSQDDRPARESLRWPSEMLPS